LEINQTKCIDTVYDFLLTNLLQMHDRVKGKLIQHIGIFPATSDDNGWVRKPFDDAASFTLNTVSTQAKGRFIEISNNYGFRNSFESVPLIRFWLRLRSEFPVLAGKPVTFSLKAFYSCASLKTK
jgi:hypothetical protein